MLYEGASLLDITIDDEDLLQMPENFVPLRVSDFDTLIQENNNEEQRTEEPIPATSSTKETLTTTMTSTPTTSTKEPIAATSSTKETTTTTITSTTTTSPPKNSTERNSEQNVLIAEATIHQQPSRRPSTRSQDSSTSQPSTSREVKRKRTEPFSTVNEDEIEELFVDSNSPVKKRSRDSQYNRKCHQPGACEKCGKQFKRIDKKIGTKEPAQETKNKTKLCIHTMLVDGYLCKNQRKLVILKLILLVIHIK